MIGGSKNRKAKIKKLSDICSDIAQIAVASVAIPFLIDKFDFAMVVLGGGVAVVFWFLSVLSATE